MILQRFDAGRTEGSLRRARLGSLAVLSNIVRIRVLDRSLAR